MVLSVLYTGFQHFLQLVLLLFLSTEFKELEIVALRHELAVLRNRAGWPTFRSADRWFLAAATWMLPRVRWSSFSSRRPRCCVGIGISWPNAGTTDDGQVDRQSTARFEH